MRQIVPILGAVVTGLIIGTIAEGLIAPLLKPILTSPRDGVVVHWIGEAISIVAAIVFLKQVEVRKAKA